MSDKLSVQVTAGQRHQTAVPSKPKHKVPQTAGSVSSYEGWFNSECLNPVVSSSARNRELQDHNSDSLLCLLEDESSPDCKKLCSSSSFFDCSGRAKPFRRRRTQRNCQSSVSWEPPLATSSSFKECFPNIDDLFPSEVAPQENRAKSSGKIKTKSRTAGYRQEGQIPGKDRPVEISYSRSSEAGNLSTEKIHHVFSERSKHKIGLSKYPPEIVPTQTLPPIYQKPLFQQVNWSSFHSSFEPIVRPSSKFSETSLRTISPFLSKMAHLVSSSDTNLLRGVQGNLQRLPQPLSELYPFQGNLRKKEKTNSFLETNPLNNSPFFDATVPAISVPVHPGLKKFNLSTPFFDCDRSDSDREAVLRMTKVKTDFPNKSKHPLRIQTPSSDEEKRTESHFENSGIMEITSYSTESLPSQHSARKSGSQEGKILVGVGCPWEEDHIPSEDSCHLDMEATDINSSNLRTITRTLDRFNERAQDTINHSLPGALSSMEDSFQDFPIHRKDYLAEEGLYERSQKNEEFIGASRTSSSTTVILDSKDVYDSVRYNSLSNKESETALLQLAQPNSTNSGFKPQIKQTTLPAFNIRKPMQCSAPCLNPSPAHELRTQGDISNKSRKRPVYRTEMQSKIPTLLSPNSKLAKQKYKDPANKNNSASSPSIPSSKGNNLSVTFEGIQKVPEPYPIKGMSGDFVDEVLAPELNPRPWVDCFPTKYNEEDFEKEFHFQLIEPVSVRKNNVSGSESSMDSSSTYVIENASSRSQTMYASSLEPRHSIPYESSGHSTESLTCFLPNVSHKDRNVMTCMHRNLKRGCKSFRDCSVRQKPAGRNMRCKTSTTLQSSSPFSTRPTYKNSNSGRRNMKDPNSRVMPNELMESSGWQNPQECTGEEKSLKVPATVEYSNSNNELQLFPSLCPRDCAYTSSTAKLELDPFRAVRIPSFELVPAMLQPHERVREVSKIELNFELHLDPMWNRNLIVEKHSSTSGNQSNSRFNEAFKNCLLPDMLPSTTNIPRDSLNIMREAGDFLTAYRKPGSSSFVDKLPEFAAYYDLMHETEPTSVQYSNIPSLPVSPSTSNTTSDTVQSFRSQKSNRRCNLRGWARCMSFCRRNFSLRKTSLSSRFRFLFPRCCCSRRWHYRHSTQFTQK